MVLPMVSSSGKQRMLDGLLMQIISIELTYISTDELG